MSHGFEMEPPAGATAATPRPQPSGISAILARVNTLLVAASMCAMVLTALVLTYSVVSRYFFKAPTDWQDEASVFMLIGVTFLSAAHVQAQRGHIGIEALAAILPPAANAARLLLVDILSFLFCAFFSWKSWTLFHEAWRDGQTTTSTFAPPLSIPYGMMAFGMTLLTLQILVQLLTRLDRKRVAP
jgi:TRAP-type C4-dicarboxylate transport system permease small subunit